MTRTVKFRADDIKTLPDDQPVVYRIFNLYGLIIYIGSAEKGTIRDKLRKHLDGDDVIPEGVTVEIETQATMESARDMERGLIRRLEPKYNKGKG